LSERTALRPKVKSTKLLWLGGAITAAYLAGLVYYCYSARTQMTGLLPNEVGDFLAGAFSPLAFLWLVLGYFQQGRELENSANVLWLQGQELQNSVEQQRELVEVTREQLDHERDIAKNAELRAINAFEAEAARARRAKEQEHNDLIDQIVALGVVATDDARQWIDKQAVQYAKHKGTIGGLLSSRHLTQLANFLVQAKLKTADVELLAAINRLEDALQPQSFNAEGGAAFVERLNEQFDRIHDALQSINKMRAE
jgi:hypothetical protein